MVFRVGAEMDAVGVTTMSKNSMAEVEEFKLKFSIWQNALSKVIGSKNKKIIIPVDSHIHSQNWIFCDQLYRGGGRGAHKFQLFGSVAERLRQGPAAAEVGKGVKF